MEKEKIKEVFLKVCSDNKKKPFAWCVSVTADLLGITDLEVYNAITK